MDDDTVNENEYLYCYYCEVRIRNPRKSTCPKCGRGLSVPRAKNKEARVLVHTIQERLPTDQIGLDKFLR